MSAYSILLLLLATGYVWAMAWRSVRAYRLRVVHCPGTHTVATLRILDPSDAATFGFRTRPHVTSCSLWPDQWPCRENCLAELQASPDHCAFQQILARWYKGKSCAFCQRPIPPIRWGEMRPALLSPEGRMVAWEDVTPHAIDHILSSHRPVCASCDVAESFRQRYSDIVVERIQHRPDRRSHHPPSV
jgi:hypothetical protein